MKETVSLEHFSSNDLAKELAAFSVASESIIKEIVLSPG
jgi:hypothetical protein